MKKQTTTPVAASNDNTSARISFNPIRSVYRWVRINGISSTLHKLDDRTLEDIGVNRADIGAIAKRIADNQNRPAA